MIIGTLLVCGMCIWYTYEIVNGTKKEEIERAERFGYDRGWINAMKHYGIEEE